MWPFSKKTDKEKGQEGIVSAGKVNRIVVVGHGFMPTQADLNLACRLWGKLNHPINIRDCYATTVECPLGTRRADLLAEMEKSDWGLALLGKYFKDNILAGDKIEYTEFEKETGEKVGIIVSRQPL
ncbi:MAG: hypothetical protein MUO27_05855 [Sedimentisphaerales bacterium]|nr:hypothetical protein [Sedimentisphaerales bacterium]